MDEKSIRTALEGKEIDLLAELKRKPTKKERALERAKPRNRQEAFKRIARASQ